MCLQNPLQELLESEKQVQQDINNSIDNFEHIIFNAGAGAGKQLLLSRMRAFQRKSAVSGCGACIQ